MADIDTTGWTKDEIEALAEVSNQLELAEEARAAAQKRTAAEVIAERRRELASAKRAADLAARERGADDAFAQACDELGSDRVGRLRTVEGSVIIRSLTAAEVDRSLSRNTESLSRMDQVKLARAEVENLVLFPPGPSFKQLVERFPGLWTELFFLRDLLTSGVRADLAKKD